MELTNKAPWGRGRVGGGRVGVPESHIKSPPSALLTTYPQHSTPYASNIEFTFFTFCIWQMCTPLPPVFVSPGPYTSPWIVRKIGRWEPWVFNLKSLILRARRFHVFLFSNPLMIVFYSFPHGSVVQRLNRRVRGVARIYLRGGRFTANSTSVTPLPRNLFL